MRVTQIVFGPPSPFPVAFRVMGPDPDKLRDIAAQVGRQMHPRIRPFCDRLRIGYFLRSSIRSRFFFLFCEVFVPLRKRLSLVLGQVFWNRPRGGLCI